MINISKKIELTQEQIKELIYLHNKGYGKRRISKEMNIKEGVIYRYKKELGLHTLEGKDLSKYSYDRTVFNKIDTEEKAYWLGFLYADGCVHKRTLSIRLKKEDDIHLKKFLKFLKSNKTMQYGKQNSFGTITEYVSLQINSVDIVEDLKNLGCLERKSLKLTFPDEEIIPKELVFHFIRGYLDGDGSITFTKRTKAYEVKFVGTENFLNGIKNILGVNPPLRKRRETDECFCFAIGGNIQVLNILNKIYENSTIYLDRKYKRYIELVEKYSKV